MKLLSTYSKYTTLIIRLIKLILETPRGTILQVINSTESELTFPRHIILSLHFGTDCILLLGCTRLCHLRRNLLAPCQNGGLPFYLMILVLYLVIFLGGCLTLHSSFWGLVFPHLIYIHAFNLFSENQLKLIPFLSSK